MDSFEQLVSEIFWKNGYWVQTSYKVGLTKEEKRKIGRPSSPRWEIDVVAYQASTNVLMALECKSYLNSPGVKWRDVCGDSASRRYKLFRESTLREIVLKRLAAQMIADGRCAENVSIELGLVAGNIYSNDEQCLVNSFASNNWHFFGPQWLKTQIHDFSKSGYENQISAVVAKLLTSSQ